MNLIAIAVTVSLTALTGMDEQPGEPASDAPEQLAGFETETLAFEDISDEDVYAAALQSIEGIDTLRANFQQTSPSGTVYTGTLSLDRPGRLRFDYDAPSPQLIVATGGLIYVHDSELETTDSYPVREKPLRFLLSRDIETDEAVLDGVYRSADGVAIALSSREEDVEGALALVFTAPDMTLAEWAIFEPSGAVTRVALSDIETGVRLPGRLFRAPDSGGTFLRNR